MNGIFLLALALTLAEATDPGCFRAAVLDHVYQVKFNQTELNIDVNLKMYNEAAAVAKENGADIIVFPESCPLGADVLPQRPEALKHHEKVPKPGLVPCDSKSTNIYAVVWKLSCMAKKYGLFLVADVIDKQSCEDMGFEVTDPKCPKDKHFLFNTAVVFDRKGGLIGKYHKMQLFTEQKKNPAPRDELIVMDTELGRLAPMVCFDMLFNKPGHYLASEHKVDTVLFPTHWFDEAPFLRASQLQSAWALTNKVNLLAANRHEIEFGTLGSGIYSGSRNDFFTVNTRDVQDRVILGTLPKSINSNATCELDPKIFFVPQETELKESKQYWYQSLIQQDVVRIPLEEKQNLISGCSNGVCCQLEYKLDQSNLKAPVSDYSLMIANRTRTWPYPWTEEFCALVHCHKGPYENCSLFTENATVENSFYFAKLSGEFSSTTTVYPSAIGANYEIIRPTGNWTVKEAKQTTTSKKVTIWFESSRKAHLLSTLSLYGRAYARDPPYHQ